MKAKLFVGKPGIGKTYKAEQYALENDLYLVEYNASDERTAASLKSLSASQSITVTGKKIMYLFDEADNMDKGGSKKLAEFLKANTKMVVFLTANNLKKVAKEVQNECDIEEVYPKTEFEIEEILRNVFIDKLGFKDVDIFEELITTSAKNCKGDLRKAQQLMRFQSTTKYTSTKLDSLKALKLILYEKDRKIVYDYIRQIPISSLYSWLFETFVVNRDKQASKMMQEINRNLYKLNEVYLYSFIAFELPARESKMVERLPMSAKLPKVEESIVEKIGKHYKCGRNEALQYLNLLKTIASDKYCREKVADKCRFTKGDREHLGISTMFKNKVEAKQPVKTSRLLQY